MWQEILAPVTLAFSGEVVYEKNHENPSIFVKVMVKNQWNFFMWTLCILKIATRRV